jgi:hypothetical protein
MTTRIEIELREQIVVLDDIKISPAEPDVGIMGSYIDGYSIKDIHGVPLDWDLTKEEEELVSDKLQVAIDSYDEPDDDYEPSEARSDDHHLDTHVDREGRLDDTDPDWRSHFLDVDTAYHFYFPGYPGSAR